MRIAVFHDLPSGGAKRSLFETAQRLAKRHTLDVYVFGTANEEFCDLRPFANNYRVYPLTSPRLLKSPFGRYNQLSRWRHLQKIRRICRKIAADIDLGDYDVVLVHPSQWTQAPLVLPYLKTPSVYYCHEVPRHLYESIKFAKSGTTPSKLDRFDPFIKLYRQTARQLDWEATQAADTVLVNSQFTGQIAGQVYGVAAQVCYNGVDTDVFHPVDDCAKQNYVLSVGALQPLKGFDFLIESVALMPLPQRPQVRLVGNSEAPGYRPFLEHLAGACGVNLRIEVGLPLADLVCRYNEAALLAYVPYNEPFGLVPLEAMACGTPVLAVAEGGVLESVVDGVNGRLLPRDPHQFAATIQSWLENPQLSRQLAEQGRAYVLQKWSWDEVAVNLETYLEQTAVNKPKNIDGEFREMIG
jgi:glycosyltransferase involved in cell wall biosynthesis